MSTENKYQMGRERYDELVEELEHLKTVRTKEVSEQIKEARSFGDLSENSEYDEAKTEQGKVYSKIAELEDLIEHAIIINKTAATGKVTMGSKVTVTFEEDGETCEETYEIVGSQEADPREFRVSNDSPFGRALLGHAPGDVVTVEAAEPFNVTIQTITH